MAAPTGLGPLLRMRALPLSQLPSHPTLSSHQQGHAPPDIRAFAAAALEEANAFMTTYVPHNFAVKNAGKKSPPSIAEVALSARDILASELPRDAKDSGGGGGGGETENWFARTSVHENQATTGTASWEEFDFGLRVDHSQHEKDYTPGVQDAHEMLNWDAQLSEHGRKIGAENEGDGEEWEDVHASVMEMQHHIPAPLNNRVFSVLVITAKKVLAPAQAGTTTPPGSMFLVVQIPVETKGLQGAKYAGDAKVTEGMYASVERVELVEAGAKVQWQMATASDAKGNLPMWAQKMGVPGAVVKDVGLFIQWTADRRGKS